MQPTEGAMMMKFRFTKKQFILGASSVLVAITVLGVVLYHHAMAAAPQARHDITPLTITTHTTAQGFDVCHAPAISAMQAWWQHAPYRWVNIYIGGLNRACPDGPSADWVAAVYQMGWGLVPTYVGLQAPLACQTWGQQGAPMASDPGLAFAQGQQDAADAASSAQIIGLNPGTIIYSDMEYYRGACDAAVAAYLNGWTQQLHGLGYKAGVYLAGTNASALLKAAITQPDDVWLVNSGFVASTPGFAVQCSVYGNGHVDDSAWHGHRLYQYLVDQGYNLSHPETWGGVTMPSIDSDCADGDIVGHPETVSLAPTYSFVGQTNNGSLIMALRDVQNQILVNQQAQPNGAWSGWAPLQAGLSFAGSPVIGQEEDGRMLIVALGPDSTLWLNEQFALGKDWAGWHTLQKGLTFVGTPTVTRNANGAVAIFALGTDKAIWEDTETTANGAWSGWQHLAATNSASTPPTFIGAPVVAQDSDGRLEVFALGADHNLWLSFQQAANGSWFGWVPLQATVKTSFVGAPATVRNQDGRLQVFIRGSDQNLWTNIQKTDGGAWAGWVPLATKTPFAGDPIVGQDTDGRLEVFALGTDGDLWLDFQDTSSANWFGFARLQEGFSFAGTPAIIRNQDGRLQVFALDDKGGLWYAVQQTPGGVWTLWTAWQTGLGLHQ
jgi:hypothetical protein